MKIIFTTLPKADYQGRALTDVGANDRMLSFFHLHDLPQSFLEEYVARGYVEGDKPKAGDGTRKKTTKIKQGFFQDRPGK